MKPTILLVLTAMMMLLLSKACAQIRLQPPRFSPPFNLGSTNLNLVSSNKPQGKLFDPLPPTPEFPRPETPLPTPPLSKIPPAEMPEPNFSPGRLPPGVYETKPYAGIVIVPPPEHDDISILRPGIYPASRMPVIHPHIEVIPKRQTQP